VPTSHYDGTMMLHGADRAGGQPTVAAGEGPQRVLSASATGILNDGNDVTDTDLLAFRADSHEVTNWRAKLVLIHMGSLIGVNFKGRQRISRYTHRHR